MVYKKRRARLKLNLEDRMKLEGISRSQTSEVRRVERAKMILAYVDGERITDIARQLNTSRPRVERCLDRALQEGPLDALEDRQRSGRPRKITPEARAWVVSLACQKPKDLGYSYELWTLNLLAQHAHQHCRQAGHPSLSKVGRGTLWKILQEDEIKPHKVRYYLEKRDEQFEEKMAQVLEVYRSVEKIRDSETSPDSSDLPTVYLSYDEKPGIQAIENTAPDLPPVPGKYPSLSREQEYERHGTLSFLAGIDLVTGQAHGLVRDRHRSREFIEFLDYADTIYPSDTKIHLILDNHSAHTSKETQAYLATKQGRFEFTFTPKHGSWLNLIETFFSKMARTVLRAIRVSSKDELRQRIELYLEEVNSSPVVFRWSYGLAGSSS